MRNAPAAEEAGHNVTACTEGYTMYYVIESKYVGPNQDQSQYCDVDTIGIFTAPGKTNSSREVRLEGWLGTTNDWSEYAHGEYESVEAAEAAIREKWGHTRDTTPSG